MIELKQVNIFYGKKRVLEDVSFSFNPGEITALIGLNGCGKTTLMKAIMGLTPIQSGQVLLDGRPLTFQDFQRLVYVPDNISVVKGMTIQESLNFMEDFYPNYSRDKARDLLAFFQLDPQDKIAQLSKGNVAKVNILLALAIDSDYILLDEPFSGIDVLTREEIARVFVSSLFQGKGVLVSTHEVEDIEHLIDKVILLDQGRILKSFYLEDHRLASSKTIRDIMREVG